MKVAMERYVEQVLEDLRYKGYVKIAETQIDYELAFGVPIRVLATIDPPKDEAGIHRLFKLTVSKEEKAIELTTEEYVIFLTMIVDLALEFAQNPQTHDSNRRFMRLVGKLPIDPSVSIGMTSNGYCEFSPELCELLNGAKFDCKLSA